MDNIRCSCCCSVAQSFWTLCDPMDCSTPAFLVLYHPPRACSNPCSLSPWCHPTISSSVDSFFSCLWSFPKSGSFLMSRLFASGGQSIRVSSSASVLSVIIQDWLVWSLCSPRDSQESSPTPHFKSINSLMFSLLYGPTLTSIHDYWKTITMTSLASVGKVRTLFLICCLSLS